MTANSSVSTPSSVAMAVASEQLTIIGRLRARPGREAELRAALLEVLKQSRWEPGCINYDLHASRDDPGLFLLYENWTGEEALKAHFETSHSTALATRFDELLAVPLEVERLKEISSFEGRKQAL